MLSPQAWNAFLKTLEEPPPSTIFVLATTEAQKVLPTVVDRCHRFDFTRPSVEQIAGVLRRVAEQEGIELPEAAVGLIARGATGSFRDALGTLEQLVTYSGASIELDDVLAVLGVVDAELLFGALDAVAAHDRPRGAAGRRAARRVRAATRASSCATSRPTRASCSWSQTLGEVPAELRVTADRDERLLAQAARLTATDVTRLLDLVAAAQDAVKNGADPRIQLELALVKAASPGADASTQALLNRIERLEARLAGGPPAADGGDAAEAPREVERQPPFPPAQEPDRGRRGDGPGRARGRRRSRACARCGPPCSRRCASAPGSLKAGIFAEASPAAVSDGELVVTFPPSATFKRRKAQDREYCEALADAVRAVTGARVSAALRARRRGAARRPRRTGSPRRSWSPASWQSSTPRSSPPTNPED